MDSSNSMSNLNNFQPVYDANEPNRPRPLHIDLNAPAKAFEKQPVDYCQCTIQWTHHWVRW